MTVSELLAKRCDKSCNVIKRVTSCSKVVRTKSEQVVQTELVDNL